ncbi:unnamed protein product [Amoebophrya sp. A120]|nr:unnamed protein product [Amoebophrya sp. A120]|eukprot:GSA120T00006834001.1
MAGSSRRVLPHSSSMLAAFVSLFVGTALMLTDGGFGGAGRVSFPSSLLQAPTSFASALRLQSAGRTSRTPSPASPKSTLRARRRNQRAQPPQHDAAPVAAAAILAGEGAGPNTQQTMAPARFGCCRRHRNQRAQPPQHDAAPAAAAILAEHDATSGRLLEMLDVNDLKHCRAVASGSILARADEQLLQRLGRTPTDMVHVATLRERVNWEREQMMPQHDSEANRLVEYNRWVQEVCAREMPLRMRIGLVSAGCFLGCAGIAC